MENKFYMDDDFEQFLKESADDFRMYPSKRVWNSLYNNLHPGRKWPSLTVSLLLVSSVIFIGLAHRNQITGSAKLANTEASASLIASNTDLKSKSENGTNELLPVTGSDKTIIAKNSYPANNTQMSERTAAVSSSNTVAFTNITSGGQRAVKSNNQASVTVLVPNEQNEESSQNFAAHRNIRTTVKQSTNMQLTSATAEADHLLTVVNDEEGDNATNENTEPVTETSIRGTNIKADVQELEIAEEDAKNEETTKAVLTVTTALSASNTQQMRDNEWIEDFAFHNKPTTSLKSKLLYELYITPSIGYRNFTKNVNYAIPARSSLLATADEEQIPGLQQAPALNLEAGYNILYPKSKSIRFKAGIQFNYTNYKSYAFDQGHSSLTTLLLNDAYSGGVELKQRSSTLANLPGNNSNTKLNNFTFQVAVPLGIDFKLAGKHNFQWFAGATVQPTYVLFGNAYLISSDMKNYVYDANFLRKWNINAGVETFVSYKTKRGVIFNAGPQVRYQLFSTYRNSYTYTEKLFNFGVKVGMVRTF